MPIITAAMIIGITGLPHTTRPYPHMCAEHLFDIMGSGSGND
jgi:hypothetical protein